MNSTLQKDQQILVVFFYMKCVIITSPAAGKSISCMPPLNDPRQANLYL